MRIKYIVTASLLYPYGKPSQREIGVIFRKIFISTELFTDGYYMIPKMIEELVL